MTAEEVYVFTRIAGDKVGATKMDRPEDVEASPRSGRVYAALTNNKERGAKGEAGPDEANPRNSNKHGQVLEFAEKGDDAAAHSFTWRLFLVCGDPEDPSTYFGGFPKDQVSPISCPDNVTFDAYGNLWISTDGNHWARTTACSASPRRPAAWRGAAVPDGPDGRRDLRADRAGAPCAGGRTASGRGGRGERGGARLRWPDGPDAYVRPSVVSVWCADGSDIGV